MAALWGQNRNVLRCCQPSTLPSGNRRRRILLMGLAAVSSPVIGQGTKPQTPAQASLKIGTTAVFLDDQLQLLDIWRADLRATLGRDVMFIQRRSYGEIVDLLLRSQIDAAWICGYPYVLNAERLPLLAVPQYRGVPLYRSHLIVRNIDSTTDRISMLKDRVFAYSDPLSNSGFLVPRAQLIQEHDDPQKFFRKSFFTFAHKKVVQAVAAGLADGGAVDGYVWDTIVAQFPTWASGARVAWRSPEYGFPPLVARADLPSEVLRSLQKALLSMEQRPDGRLILARLALDRFVAGEDRWYDGIRKLISISQSTPEVPGENIGAW